MEGRREIKLLFLKKTSLNALYYDGHLNGFNLKNNGAHEKFHQASTGGQELRKLLMLFEALSMFQ